MTEQAPTVQIVTERGQAIAAAVVEDPAHTLLALDFDGTLSPIVDDPEQAVVHPRSRAALERLWARLGTVAVITGRPVETVRRLAGLEPGAAVVVLGQYGVERWDAETDTLVLPPVPAALETAKQHLAEVVARSSDTGLHLEDKGRAVALHTRRAVDPTGLQRLLMPEVVRLASNLGLHLEPGRHVLEVRAAGVSKGDALRGLVAERGAGPVLMVGDDLGDLPAFDALDELASQGHGVACVVSGSDEQPVLRERADLLCAGPDGVADWLTSLADALDAAREH